MHGGDKPDQTKIVIAVQMAYKDCSDAVELYRKPGKLNLGCFSTVNQQIVTVNLNQLGSLVPVMCRNCGIVAQDFYLKTQSVAVYSWFSSRSVSISFRKTASMASSTVGRILRTLLSCDILMSFIT